MNVTPTGLPTVKPLVSGSRISFPRMYAPTAETNCASVDQGPYAPCMVARTCHVCRLPKSSAVGIVTDVPPTAPPATLAFESLNTSNSYCNAAATLVVDGDQVSVGCASDTWTPLIGEVGTGAVAFNVDPSAAASAAAGAAPDGDVGVAAWRLQARVTATKSAKIVRASLCRCINLS